MNKGFIVAALLPLIAQTAPAFAQPTPEKTLESLYERGKQEMAPNWRAIGITHRSAVFLHNDVRKTDNGQVAVWAHNELATPDYLDKEKAYLSIRERMVVDCKSSRLGTADQAYYAQHFARGAVVGTNRINGVEMQEVVPDSIEELLVKTACPVARKKTASKTAAKKPAK